MRHIVSLLGLLVVLSVAPLSAQRLELGWDKAEHFAAGAGINVAGLMILPKTKPWQRVLVTTTIGAAYELGQSERDRFDVWDLTADFLGAIVVEAIW